jgi:hypothetical protein
MPGLGEGLLALKQTMGLPVPAGVPLAKDLGVTAPWLRLLHYAWTIEAAHAPGLVTALLREGPVPARTTLRPLASGLFPIEAVAATDPVVVILHGDGRGLDTLLPLADAGATDVTVYHPDDAERAVLAATYPASWHYCAFEPGCDIVPGAVTVVDPPLLRAAAFLRDELDALVARLSGTLILGVSQQAFAMLKCERPLGPLFAERYGRMHGRALVCRQSLFRHGEPEEMFWLWLEPAAA